MERNIAAICCSDLHLSARPPAARSAEPDWFEAQARPLRELRSLAEKHLCPVIVAGDLFDRWDTNAETINFAMRELPERVHAVPGQHDLPFHSYDEIRKSAYWTLVEAGRIINLVYGEPVEVPGAWPLRLHGFPFGFKLRPCKKPHDLMLEVAVVHRYVWRKGFGHPGAKDEDRLKNVIGRLAGYDAAVFGDNHIGFSAVKSNTGAANKWEAKDDGLAIMNCGTFMRRKSDEKNYEPRIGLLQKDGWIAEHFLDCSLDKFASGKELAAIIERGGDVSGLVAELSKLDDGAIDFAAALRKAVRESNLDGEGRRAVLEALEG